MLPSYIQIGIAALYLSKEERGDRSKKHTDSIKQAFNFFDEFHQGAVNRVAHVIGFAGLFYSVYKLDWKLFALFLIIWEGDLSYNHFADVKVYDVRPKVALWRVFTFPAVVAGFYLISEYLLRGLIGN